MAPALSPLSRRRSPDQELTRLFDRHAAALLSFARSYVGDGALAEDVVQQTFLAAHRTLAAGTRIEHPRAWLFKVARNNALMAVRDRAPASVGAALAEELEARAAAVPEQVEQREALREVVSDIAALPPEQRAALTLFELGDFTHTEIAVAIGVEQRKVKALVYQARTTLVDQREARDATCASVRELLATTRGGALNNRLLRHHLRRCEACAAFRDDLRDTRRRVALLLPVPLLPAFKAAVLGGVAAGGTAAATAGGSGAGALAQVAARLTGKARWLAGGGATAAAAAVAAAAVLGSSGPAPDIVREAARPATTQAAPAPVATSAPARATPSRPAPKPAERPARQQPAGAAPPAATPRPTASPAPSPAAGATPGATPPPREPEPPAETPPAATPDPTAAPPAPTATAPAPQVAPPPPEPPAPEPTLAPTATPAPPLPAPVPPKGGGWPPPVP